MFLIIMKKAILGMFSIVLAVLVIGSAALLLFSQRQVAPSEKTRSLNLNGYRVVHIGDGNNISTQVVDLMKDYGAQITLLSETTEDMELNDSLIVIFDAQWIGEKIDDPQLHDFLRNAAPKEVKLVAIGESTSKFFEALDKAGVCEIPVTETGHVRNPAYFNPPMVGYKLRKAITPNGIEYFGDSILLNGTHDIDQLVQAVTNWN